MTTIDNKMKNDIIDKVTSHCAKGRGEETGIG